MCPPILHVHAPTTTWCTPYYCMPTACTDHEYDTAETMMLVLLVRHHSACTSAVCMRRRVLACCIAGYTEHLLLPLCHALVIAGKQS